MEYQIKKRDDVAVLKLSGEVTIYQIQQFKEAIEALKRQKFQTKNLVIDLKDVGYFDALALGSLCSFSRELREKGGDLKLAQVSPDVKVVFDLTHLSKVYEIYDDLEKAVKSFR